MGVLGGFFILGGFWGGGNGKRMVLLNLSSINDLALSYKIVQMDDFDGATSYWKEHENALRFAHWTVILLRLQVQVL